MIAGNEIKVLLIRHGSTAGNKEKRYIGAGTDEDLCESGVGEVLELKGRLPHLDGEFLLCSSPLKRCRSTASILFPGRKPFFEPRLREMEFGDFEGKNYLDLSGDEDYQRWIDSGGTIAFPNGESRQEFSARSLEGFAAMVREGARQGTDCAGVVHGGTIMAVMSGLTGLDYYTFLLPPASAIELTLTVNGERIDVVSYHSLDGRLHS